MVYQWYTITALTTTDRAGGKADLLNMTLRSGIEDFMAKRARPGDVLRVVQDTYDSGDMFVDTCRLRPGYQEVPAASIPPEAKLPRNQGWQDVTLLELLSEISARYSFALKTYGVQDQLYKRVRQEDEADFAFLARRCTLERCALKLYDRNVIVYGADFIEGAQPQARVDVGNGYQHWESVTFDGVRLRSVQLRAEYVPGAGPRVWERSDIPFYSIGEGERFCRGLFWELNRRREVLQYSEGGIAAELGAGSLLAVTGEGDIGGNYLVDTIWRDLVQQSARMESRRV